MDRKTIYNRAMEIQSETPLEHAIRLGGGITKFAKSLGLKSHMVVYQWTKTRVPAEHCPVIERESKGVIRCEDLRPDVEWGVLRQALPEPVASETEAVVVAVLIAPHHPDAPADQTARPVQPVEHRSQAARRVDTTSPYDHTDIDRRDEEGATHLRRKSNELDGQPTAQGATHV